MNKNGMIDYYYDLGSDNKQEKNNTIGARLRRLVSMLLAI